MANRQQLVITLVIILICMGQSDCFGFHLEKLGPLAKSFLYGIQQSIRMQPLPEMGEVQHIQEQFMMDRQTDLNLSNLKKDDESKDILRRTEELFKNIKSETNLFEEAVKKSIKGNPRLNHPRYLSKQKITDQAQHQKIFKSRRDHPMNLNREKMKVFKTKPRVKNEWLDVYGDIQRNNLNDQRQRELLQSQNDANPKLQRRNANSPNEREVLIKDAKLEESVNGDTKKNLDINKNKLEYFMYVNKNGDVQQSKFTEAEVNMQVLPFHAMKIETLFSKDPLQIDNLYMMKEVANKHITKKGVQFDLDAVFIDMLQNMQHNEDLRYQKILRDNQAILEAQRHKPYKNPDQSETFNEYLEKGIKLNPETDQQIDENSNISVLTDLSFDGSRTGSANSFADLSELNGFDELMSDQNEDAEIIEGKEREDVKQTQNVQENEPVGYLNLDSLKQSNTSISDFLEKNNNMNKNKNIKIQLKNDEPLTEMGSFIANLKEERDDSENSQLNSTDGEVGSDVVDRDKLLDFNQSLDLKLADGVRVEFTSAQIISGESSGVGDNDYFRFYYDTEFIFKSTVCQIYITEIKEFQIDMDLNHFICQYFASILAGTSILDLVEDAKLTLGTKLIQVVSNYKDEFRSILNKHVDNMKSVDKQELKERMELNLPLLLDDLLTLVENMAEDYIASYNKDNEEIIEPFINEIMDKFGDTGISRKSASRVVVATYTTFKDDPQLYRTRLFSLLQQFEVMLGEGNKSQFFEILPDLLLVDQNSLCNSYHILTANYYYFDCGNLFMQTGIKDQLYSKCKDYFNSLISIAESIPNMCMFLKSTKWLYDDIYMMATVELAQNLHLHKTVNLEYISRKIFDLMTGELEKVSSLVEMYKHFTTRNLQFTRTNTLRLYPLFYKMRFIFSNNNDSISEKVRIVDQFMVKYFERMRVFKFGIAGKVTKLIMHIFKEVANKEKSTSLQNKMKNQSFRNAAKFYCVVSNDLLMSTLCKQIYEKMNFPFLYKYYHYEFVFEYVNSKMHEYIDDFDMENNDEKKIVAFFKIHLRSSMIEIRNDLINSLYIFSPTVLDSVPKETLILILIFIKTYQLDVDWEMDQEFKEFINIYIQNNIEELVSNILETGLQHFFYEFAQELLRKKNVINIMRFDKLVIYFIREITDFKGNVKLRIMENLGEIYSHFDNWDPTLIRYIAKYKLSDSKEMMLQCKEDVLEKGKTCQRINASSSFVTASCPPFTTNTENGLCMTDCPEGFVGNGIYCFKPSAFMRKIFNRAEDCNPSLGCSKLNDGLYISNCPELFVALSIICFPVCPLGMIDEGTSCKKKIVDTIGIYY